MKRKTIETQQDLCTKEFVLNDKEFYAIGACRKKDMILCVASSPWYKGIWGRDVRGERSIITLADPSSAVGYTHSWYSSLPKGIIDAMLCVPVGTFEDDAYYLTELETKMFVPSAAEWMCIPHEIRLIITNGIRVWTRTALEDTGTGISCIDTDGELHGSQHGTEKYGMVPAFYLKETVVRQLLQNVT